jgi:hypothetical protein
MEFSSQSQPARRASHRFEPPPSGVAREPIVVLLIEDDDGDALLVEELLSDGALNVRLIRSRTLREGLDRLPARSLACCSTSGCPMWSAWIRSDASGPWRRGSP